MVFSRDLYCRYVETMTYFEKSLSFFNYSLFLGYCSILPDRRCLLTCFFIDSQTEMIYIRKILTDITISQFSVSINIRINPLPRNPGFKTLPHSPAFWCTKRYKGMENIVKKGELLVTSNFSFSHNVLYLCGTYFLFKMHFKMSSAICFILDQVKICRSVMGSTILM